MANNELTIDQLKAITGSGPLRGVGGVSARGAKTKFMRDTVDSCNMARPSWHKISNPWNHPRYNIQGNVFRKELASVTVTY